MRKTALIILCASSALAGTAEAHVAGCHSRECDRRVSKKRHAAFPRRHPERYAWRRSKASWYGPGFYGHGMACGGALSTGTRGVANRTLPCGTRIVLCARTCAEAAVVDRGPYVAGREFDLTPGTRSDTGFGSTGTVRWRVRR